MKKLGALGIWLACGMQFFCFSVISCYLLDGGGAYHQGGMARNPLLSTFSLLGAHTGQDSYSNSSLSPHLCVLALVSVCGSQRLVLECLPYEVSHWTQG